MSRPGSRSASRVLWHRFRRWWTADRIRVQRRMETAAPRVGDRLQWGRRVFRVTASDGMHLDLREGPAPSSRDEEALGEPFELRIDGETWLLSGSHSAPQPLPPDSVILYRQDPATGRGS